MYLGHKCKPNNGNKIQNLANVLSGIMLCIKVVKSTAKEKAIATATASGANNDDDATNEGKKGTNVLLELTEWCHHSNLWVTADVYFGSLKAALKLKDKVLFLISNAKQCSRRFLMVVLGNTTFPKQGLQLVLASIYGNTGETNSSP
jgi:hypothetical protein